MSEGDGILHTAPTDFRARHLVALERNEARHMMMLGVLSGADTELTRVQFWTVGWFRLVRDPESERPFNSW